MLWWDVCGCRSVCLCTEDEFGMCICVCVSVLCTVVYLCMYLLGMVYLMRIKEEDIYVSLYEYVCICIGKGVCK